MDIKKLKLFIWKVKKYKILVGYPEGTRSRGRHRLQGSMIKDDEGRGWIELLQDRVHKSGS
jgi:1-acyl-sn-glycerol-3-phosphate acyltransferase